MAAVLLAGAVVGSGTLLLVLQSHLTFFVDDWDFLLYRRGSSAAVFLDPHVDHLSVAPIAIYKALLALFGMRSDMPFSVVSTLVFLLSAVLLFTYVRRRVGDWLALLASVLVLFLGAAWTDLLSSFQIVFFGSVAAGIGALLELERDDRVGDVLACALLVLATSFSELGVPFMAGAFVSVVLGPSGRRRRLYVPLLPLALYGIWYLHWGSKVPHYESFHNLVNSPKYVFDAVSQNIASLLGLATPIRPNSGVYLAGLNWGRGLLVIAIVLAGWRLRRIGWPSRWLWAVLAMGAAFWFLTALNETPQLNRLPTEGRYQYAGAIFVLLIAAELLRGARLDKRVLAIGTVVTVGAATSGVIMLNDGYGLRKYVTDYDRATLAAVDIARRNVRPDFPVQLIAGTYPFPASLYFSAVDAFGSPAFSETQLAAAPELDRAQADQVLAKAEGVSQQRPVTSVGLRAGVASHCSGLRPQPNSSKLALRPGVYTIIDRSVQRIQVGRFADDPLVTVGDLAPGSVSAISIPSDRSSRPWLLSADDLSAVTVCWQRASPPPAVQDTTPASSAGNRGPSEPQRFDQALIRDGFTAEQAGCVVYAVLGRTGASQFNELYGNDDPANPIPAIVYQATLTCAPRGAGK